MLTVTSRFLGLFLAILCAVLVYAFASLYPEVDSREALVRIGLLAAERPCFDPLVYRFHWKASQAVFACGSALLFACAIAIFLGRWRMWAVVSALSVFLLVVPATLHFLGPETFGLWLFSPLNFGLVSALGSFGAFMTYIFRRHT